MIPETEIMARLERLERDNRRLKKLGVVSLVLVAALAAINTLSCSSAGRQSSTKGVLDKITAREFDVLDANGKVRVKIAMHCAMPKDCWPNIDLYDQNGKELTNVGAGMLGISGKDGSTTMFDNDIQIKGSSRRGGIGDFANLGVGFMNTGAELTLSGKSGISVELMGQSALTGGEGGVLDLMGKNGNSVYLDSDSPMVEIADGKGPFMDLGSTALTTQRTGATEQTSADSIVMFGNDKKHHVIWQAP